ncbi:hypothetical protein [Sporolactobacillus laevolacticus]|uniref:Uncharacterized protein n=1 Tax=Sporolactobacillus laevolacticus DSM 442 TaxID=1395513 RepID=V6J4Y7_9BACL|nr:hypothetical protein [Sporolactobacillus laevolacticus]EST11779.1 hypothetical protein P343_10225 [Sporolactobacillus laevolacticus DSM 442]
MTDRQKKYYHYAIAVLFAAIGIWQTVDKNGFAFLFYFSAIFFLSSAMRMEKK